ncbi:putative transcriptional regulator [Pasteurella testudinis DSM 23072]|uniref:Putative transcriptional regulator n=2 Tax=Pasteurella testudinis TaxID=761 RepID=A0A1W1UIU4_9PAST|nr:putative transcriptional regulator [Pasteurella testudinis DSM 23072]SUB52008.1 Antitoxin MqsA [Pasteurella testudinis]
MNMKEMDIDDIVKALIIDEPELAAQAAELRKAIGEMREGKRGRITNIAVSPIVHTRNRAGLTQQKFAEKLGISVNTLRSWEQGQRKPSGAAAALLTLLDKRPELIAELG